jgi:O-antigen/teichoic acid export membrane protein/SAM-dependent methyltransferase
MISPEVRATRWRCPACQAPVDGPGCTGCGRSYPTVAGIPDFRLDSDRYLDLDAERTKAERLARIASETDLEGLARAYYTMTPDVDPPRCERYLSHILGAESRGEALAACLEDDGPILEVGCGTGGLLVAATRRRLEIEGVDIAARWLVVARRRLDDHGLWVPLTAASAECLPFADASFGTIVADSLIEHCDDPSAALREWRRVLRPGGQLILWSPNRFTLTTDPHVRLWGLGFLPRAWADRYVRLRRGGAWVPQTLSARGASRLAVEAGFVDVRVGTPTIPASWEDTRPRSQRSAIVLYRWMSRIGPTRFLLRLLGPIWTLEARCPGAAIRASDNSAIPPLGGGIEGGGQATRAARTRTPSNSPLARGRVLFDALRPLFSSGSTPHPNPPPQGGRGPDGKSLFCFPPPLRGRVRVGGSAGRQGEVKPIDKSGIAICLGAEVFAGALGFAATIHLARRIGPAGFATLEVAAAIAGWLLVMVRSGLDQIVVREASRHPRLIRPMTGQLLALRCVWAVVGLGLIASIVSTRDMQGSSAILAASLVLVPSALVADVGPRARNELPFLAFLQVLRGVGLAAAVTWLVAGPGDIVRAAVAPALAETLVALACVVQAARSEGLPRLLWRARLAVVLSRRAAVAGLTRFGRVGLYAADAMALAIASGSDLGSYAVGRRLVFALVAVGLVVPTLLGPGLARASMRGREGASAEVGRGVSLILGLFAPAALGLILVAGRLLPGLYGPAYAGGAMLLGLVALRLPVILAATWFQSALVAIGEEAKALRLTIGASILALAVVPVAAVSSGAVGIGTAILGVEAVAALGGWLALRRLGIDPGRSVEVRPIALGCLGLIAGVVLTSSTFLPITCTAGAIGYMIGWRMGAGRLPWSSRLVQGTWPWFSFRSTPHPNPPPQGGRETDGRSCLPPSPLEGEGRGGGYRQTKSPRIARSNLVEAPARHPR